MREAPLWLSPQQWLPVTAPVTSGSVVRFPGHLLKIVEQFEVETAPRYRPAPGTTWCNIFAWDFTRAMACEVPRLLQRGTEYVEVRANAMHDWLALVGEAHGWRACMAEEAQAAAGRGEPALVTYRHTVDARPGHIAVVVPTPRGMRGVHIAQAGGKCFSCGTLEEGFGNLPRQFWRHP